MLPLIVEQSPSIWVQVMSPLIVWTLPWMVLQRTSPLIVLTEPTLPLTVTSALAVERVLTEPVISILMIGQSAWLYSSINKNLAVCHLKTRAVGDVDGLAVVGYLATDATDGSTGGLIVDYFHIVYCVNSY